MSKNELAAELEEVRANEAKYHSVNNHQAILAERLIKRERRMSEKGSTHKGSASSSWDCTITSTEKSWRMP